MKVYVVRHGYTDWLEKKIWQGWANNPLNAKGIEQAKSAAQKIAAELCIKHFYSSDSLRARQTAEIINEKLKLKIIFDKRLRERGVGILEGTPKVENGNVKDSRTNPHKYNAESFTDVYNRIKDFFADLKARKIDNVLVVSHGAAMNVMQWYVSGKPWDEAQFAESFIDNAAILEFEI